MSQFNENISKNKDEKSSNLIIISKERKLSAKERVNFITLKEGDLKLTLKLDNAYLNKKQINSAIKSMKQQILKNSKSYASLNEDSKLNAYLKKRNNLQSPKNEIDKSSYLKKNQFINIETARSYNELKTIENNEKRNEEDQKQLETLIPYETTTQEILKFNYNKNNLKAKSEEINDKNSDNHNDNDDENIENMEIKIKDENNNENMNIKMNLNENKLIESGLVSKENFNNTKNKNLKKRDNIFDKYKSEEIKQLNSNSSQNNTYINVKNNNFVDKNAQKSDRAIKSIYSDAQEQEIDYNTKKSKLIFDSLRVDCETNNKIKRLISEYDEQNEKNRENELISERKSESKSSKTIKVDEDDDENEEEEEIKKDKNNLIESSNFDAAIIKKDNNKENFSKFKEEFDEYKRIENSKNIKQIKSLPVKQISYVYKICSICEQPFSISRLFCAECQIHFLCKKCSKNYYEDIIENGNKDMLCPFTKCRQPMDIEDLQNIISKEHYNILINNLNNFKESQTKFCKTKLKSTFDQENMQLYTKKHVIDINSNKKIFEFNNLKEVYCPNCFKETLFSKTNTHFFKCLNCGCKRCKYCLKNYNARHIDSTYIEHCKVFYRTDDYFNPDSQKCLKIFLQIFFVFASYYLCFAGAFLLIRNIFFVIFGIKKNNKIFLSIFAYLFTIICFIIVIPFIFFFYPYFPSIMALSDY